MKMRRGDVMKIERARDRDLGDLGRLLPVTRDRHHRPTDELEDIFRKSRSRSRRSREIVTRYSEIVITTDEHLARSRSGTWGGSRYVGGIVPQQHLE